MIRGDSGAITHVLGTLACAGPSSVNSSCSLRCPGRINKLPLRNGHGNKLPSLIFPFGTIHEVGSLKAGLASFHPVEWGRRE